MTDGHDSSSETAAVLSDIKLLTSIHEGLEDLKQGASFSAEEVGAAMRESRS